MTTKKTIVEFSKSSLSAWESVREDITREMGEAPKNLDLFMLAMTVGFANGTKSLEVKRSGTGVRVEYFNAPELAIMASIQLADSGETGSILDLDERLTLAELFADAGINILATKTKSRGNFLKDLVGDVMDITRNKAVEG